MITCLPTRLNRFFATLIAAASVVALLGDAPTGNAQTATPQVVNQRRLADVLEEVTPAVVNIAVISRAPAETNPLFNDPYFRRFFDLPQMPQPQPRLSAGSGVIIDAHEGYVLTNHHVIDGADEISVTLRDRRRLTAQLIGSDKATDIAVLKIEANNLVALPLGTPDSLRVGDSVVAIGNPFGLGQTVTSGIVSALDRSGLNVEGYEDFIQTDASINPGNSGGALVTADGRLVGINTAIIAPAGGNVGIGFAVPIDMATAVMKQIIEHGEVRRGRIGVSIQDLTPDLAEALGVTEASGAVVGSVDKDSSAEKAGLKAGDVIVVVDGHPITGSSDLRNRIGLAPAESEVEITYMRNGERKVVKLRVQAVSDARQANAPLGRLTGAVFQDASGNVVVGAVEANSPAALAGLRAGDIVVAVNRKTVASSTELADVLRGARGTIALELLRGSNRLLLVVR